MTTLFATLLLFHYADEDFLQVQISWNSRECIFGYWDAIRNISICVLVIFFVDLIIKIRFLFFSYKEMILYKELVGFYADQLNRFRMHIIEFARTNSINQNNSRMGCFLSLEFVLSIELEVSWSLILCLPTTIARYHQTNAFFFVVQEACNRLWTTTGTSHEVEVILVFKCKGTSVWAELIFVPCSI